MGGGKDGNVLKCAHYPGIPLVGCGPAADEEEEEDGSLALPVFTLSVMIIPAKAAGLLRFSSAPAPALALALAFCKRRESISEKC